MHAAKRGCWSLCISHGNYVLLIMEKHGIVFLNFYGNPAQSFFQALNSSMLNRRVASTSMNRESSRSHAIFTLQIESKV